MAVAYSHPLTDDELELWFNTCLRSTDVRLAGRATLRIVSEDKFWPTPARFNEIRRAIQADDEPPASALPSGPRTEQERANVARYIALCREIIKQRDTRPHWHGGPDPCPVCGGINPNLAYERKRAEQRHKRLRAQAHLKPPKDPTVLDDAVAYRRSQPP